MNLTINYCSLKHTYALQLGQVRVVLLGSLCPWPYTTYIVKLLQSESSYNFGQDVVRTVV